MRQRYNGSTRYMSTVNNYIIVERIHWQRDNGEEGWEVVKIVHPTIPTVALSNRGAGNDKRLK